MFWDSSALVPWLVAEARSVEIMSLLRADSEAVLWWASPVECLSALHRRRREGVLPARPLRRALQRLHDIVEDVDLVAPTKPLRERAGRLLAAHPLRAADALQLAAALVWCDGSAAGQSFVCLDGRLREAAAREGFKLQPSR